MGDNIVEDALIEVEEEDEIDDEELDKVMESARLTCEIASRSSRNNFTSQT
jgi:hypothetical protein